MVFLLHKLCFRTFFIRGKTTFAFVDKTGKKKTLMSLLLWSVSFGDWRDVEQKVRDWWNRGRHPNCITWSQFDRTSVWISLWRVFESVLYSKTSFDERANEAAKGELVTVL